MPVVETVWLREASGGVPNHPSLPLLAARGVVPRDRLISGPLETEAASHGWGGGWTGGIYRFHHFHADTHEALLVLSGHARVQFGGRGGPELPLAPGDLVVIPAGIGHRCVASDERFTVLGLYPGEVEPDLELPTSLSETEAAARVALVPMPRTDPLGGALLSDRWLATLAAAT